MVDKVAKEFVWAQAYRPQKIEDCILPDNLKKIFKGFIADPQNVPNLILAGSSGLGKTTAALALVRELDGESIVINGSMAGNIDTLRTDIKNYASAVSLAGKRKFVILDEADYINANSTQPALRNFMETYSRNCGFILTCNHLSRIIPELQSRCAVVEFKLTPKDKPVLAGQFLARVQEILANENVTADQRVLATMIVNYFPNFRRILNELQRAAAQGGNVIDASALAISNDEALELLVKELKAKNFTNMRKWVGENAVDSSNFFRDLYEILLKKLSNESIPQMVVTVAEYQYRDAFAVDKEINATAMLVEIMQSAVFK